MQFFICSIQTNRALSVIPWANVPLNKKIQILFIYTLNTTIYCKTALPIIFQRANIFKNFKVFLIFEHIETSCWTANIKDAFMTIRAFFFFFFFAFYIPEFRLPWSNSQLIINLEYIYKICTFHLGVYEKHCIFQLFQIFYKNALITHYMLIQI